MPSLFDSLLAKFGLQRHANIPIRFGTRKAVAGGQVPMRKNDAVSSNYTGAVAGDGDTNLKYYVANFAVNMITNAMRDFFLEREWVLVDGDEEDRNKLTDFFNNQVNVPEWDNEIIHQYYTFGKHNDEVVWDEFVTDDYGIPVTDSEGNVIYKAFSNLEKCRVKPISAQVVSEQWSNLGYIQYYKYNFAGESLQSEQNIKYETKYPVQRIATFHRDRLPGRKYGAPFATPLGYHIEHIGRCNENLGIATDKQVIGFWQVWIDPVYLDKYGTGQSQKLIDDLESVLNNQSSGDDIIMLPGTEFRPKEFTNKGIEGILKVKEALLDEMIMSMGFTPAFIRGTQPNMTQKDRAAVNAFIRLVEGYKSHEIIPRLINKKKLPRWKYKLQMDVQIDKSKSDLIYNTILPGEFKKEVAADQGLPEPDNSPTTVQPQVEEQTQIDSKDETGGFKAVNGPQKVNLIGSKKMKADAPEA